MSVTEHRPWGSFTILADEPDHKVKRIVVKAGKRLSLQSHKYREEHWTIVSGKGWMIVGSSLRPHATPTEWEVGPSDHIGIPTTFTHRIEALGDEDLVFIETQLGSYFGEDDIERLEDDFGRIPTQD